MNHALKPRLAQPLCPKPRIKFFVNNNEFSSKVTAGEQTKKPKQCLSVCLLLCFDNASAAAVAMLFVLLLLLLLYLLLFCCWCCRCCCCCCYCHCFCFCCCCCCCCCCFSCRCCCCYCCCCCGPNVLFKLELWASNIEPAINIHTVWQRDRSTICLASLA